MAVQTRPTKKTIGQIYRNLIRGFSLSGECDDVDWYEVDRTDKLLDECGYGNKPCKDKKKKLH